MSPVGCKLLTALRIAAALSVTATLAGCAGNGAGLDSNGNPITGVGDGGGGGGTAPLTADFQSIQDNVFTPICTKCHIGAGAPEGLQLDQDHSYALLVGVPSTEQPNVLRVTAGDPDNSYLIRKLQGSAGITGVQMPFGGPYLSQSTIDVIRQWITDGAAKSTAAPMTVEAASKAVRRFGVTATSPDSDSIVSMVLPNIVVAFNADVDSTLISNATVSLQRTTMTPAAGNPPSSSPAANAPPGSAPASDTADTRPDSPASITADALIPISTTIPAGNPAALLISPQAPLTGGTYRVTLHGMLADVNASALGSDYSFTFTVDSSQ